MGEHTVNGRKPQCWGDPHGFLGRVLVHPTDLSDTEGAAWRLAAHHLMSSDARDSGGRGGETRVQCIDATDHGDPPACYGTTTGTHGMCCHSAAVGGGTRDGGGGTPSFDEESIPSQSRIERRLSFSWFSSTAPESALSEIFVFDHALNDGDME